MTGTTFLPLLKVLIVHEEGQMIQKERNIVQTCMKLDV